MEYDLAIVSFRADISLWVCYWSDSTSWAFVLCPALLQSSQSGGLSQSSLYCRLFCIALSLPVWSGSHHVGSSYLASQRKRWRCSPPSPRWRITTHSLPFFFFLTSWLYWARAALLIFREISGRFLQEASHHWQVHLWHAFPPTYYEHWIWCRIYLNGSRVTNFSARSNPLQQRPQTFLPLCHTRL